MRKKCKDIRDSCGEYFRSMKTTTSQSATDKNGCKSWQGAKQMKVFKLVIDFAETDTRASSLRMSLVIHQTIIRYVFN
jgi:hypothetical protein